MGRTKQKWLMGALACASALVFSGLAHGQTGIATTKHNLGSSASGLADHNNVSDTDEICVFCHTPHGADRTVTGAPLWNKQLPGNQTYQTYSTANSTTIDGEVLTQVGAVSVTCLSCHDGTQAMDNILNAPGSGGFTTGGGGATGLAWTWTGSPRVDADGKMTGGAMLSQDLRDDHPIGIEYCGGGLSRANPTAPTTPVVDNAPCKDSDFKSPFWGSINSQAVWWVETGSTDSKRTRTDMILFTRSGFAGGTTGPSVECASCHDPHVSDGQIGPNGQVAGKTFLRISNSGSAVCLACHTK